MVRRPFEKVTAGPGQVYESEYNAFLDVAKRARGGEDVDVTKIAKGVVVPCVNRTETDFQAFDVVQLESPVVTPDNDQNEFKYKTPVFKIAGLSTVIGFAQLPEWGVLQSACAAGDSSRVMVSGISPVVIEASSLAATFAEDDVSVVPEQRGKQLFFQGPFGHVLFNRIIPFPVGQCEIIYQQPFSTEILADEEITSDTEGLEVLGLIRFPVIHHELIRATARESMPFSEDQFYSAAIRWGSTDYVTGFVFNDWLNITVQNGDRVHLGYFPDKQRLSVITCCGLGSGASTGLGCACLQGVGNGVCHIRITFGDVSRDTENGDACTRCTAWNSRAWELLPPINDPNSCEFVAQDRTNPNPEFSLFNAFEEFPCSEDTDQPTYMVLNISCISENENDSVLKLVINGRELLRMTWEDLSFFGSQPPDEIIVTWPKGGVGPAPDELLDAQAERTANNQGAFDPDTSTPALKDGTGSLCDNWLVTPSRGNPEDEVEYDFGVTTPRLVPLRQNDIVVYEGGRWVRIPSYFSNGAGGYIQNIYEFSPCEVPKLTDPYGCDWTLTAQTPSIELTFEECE